MLRYFTLRFYVSIYKFKPETKLMDTCTRGCLKFTQFQVLSRKLVRKKGNSGGNFSEILESSKHLLSF